MSTDVSTINRIFSKIDQDELVNLAMTLTDISSPTGYEQDVANFVLNWFEENGFNSMKRVVEAERFDAIGVLKGTEGRPSLMLNGHMDTVLLEKTIPKAYVSDGRIYGNEIANMKAGLATAMIAAKAIKQANVQLKGDLILAGVIGEICTGATGRFQEPQDRGGGFGTWHLLSHGIQSDYAIVTDGSEYSIVRAQAGVAFFKISTKGIVEYTPFTKRPIGIKESENAIVKMAALIDALENWAREYEQNNTYQCSGGKVTPKVSITGIEGGMPTLIGEIRPPLKAAMTAESCDLYVDVRLSPGVSPLRVQRELQDLIAGLTFECEIEMFRSQKGYEGKGPEIDYLSSVVENAYEKVFHSKPPPPAPGSCSMWTDTNLYWEIGIPAIKWGPSELSKYRSRSVAEIDGYVKAAKVYCLIALEVCGKK